tara:strand:+ start:2143 stop:3357 length:1215 start_codon:yes stop_codon:yes gene_type:complete
MSFKKFNPEEVLVNTIQTHPKCEFFIYNGRIFYNKTPELSGSFAEHVTSVPTGHVSLHEINNDKLSGSNNFIYPFITKESTLSSFKTVSSTAFHTGFGFGDTLTGSYPLSASISREYIVSTLQSSNRKRIFALQSTLDYYKNISRHYAYTERTRPDGVPLHGNKATQPINLISIPSIFYGTEIKKGTIDLKYYISGTLIGQIKDLKRNGELIQVGPEGSTGSGSVAGVALYKEGFLLLTGSWALDTNSFNYVSDTTVLNNPAWLYWGVGANDGFAPSDSGRTSLISSSYNLMFSGSQQVQTVTMLAHANIGEMNYSTNPTFIRSGSVELAFSGGLGYVENDEQFVKNVATSSFTDVPGDFEKQVYISRVAIYDDDKNLIGVATLANPVRKPTDRNLTFKLKIDM